VIPGEIRRLLGGYATGTLTEEERNLLFSAALEDQELFNALADEEALRELLAEPATRQVLLEELQRQPVDALLLRDQRVPLELAAQVVSPPHAHAEMRNLAEPLWARIRDNLTPRRLAVAGGLTMMLLIAAGIQYEKLHSPGPATVASVNLANNRTLERSASSESESAAEPRFRDKESGPRPIPRSSLPPTLDPRQGPARQVADPPGVPLTEQRPAETKGVELDQAGQPNNENRTPVPQGVLRDTETKAEKEAADAGPAREQLNQAVREQVAQARSKETVPASAPSAATFSAPPASSGKISERKSAPVSPAQIVTGGFRQAAAPSLPRARAGHLTDQISEVNAKVTDVNGTIVSINVGSNGGFKVGDAIEIVRDNRVIATFKLSQVGVTFAVGAFQSAAGSAATPRPGDAVRRVTISQSPR
jgi:hypothetical protein